MKITLSQLRKIIKEEVKRSLLRETPEAAGHIEVPKLSMIADNIGMSLDELIEEFKAIADDNNINVSYSDETGSLSGSGSYESLKLLATEFDAFVGEPAGSISIVTRI